MATVLCVGHAVQDFVFTLPALPTRAEKHRASGFASVRRFNALFRERYRLRPTDLRRGREENLCPETLLCEIAYRPPLDWARLLAFLESQRVPGVEVVHDGRYLRTVALGGRRGWLTVAPAAGRPRMLESLPCAPSTASA